MTAEGEANQRTALQSCAAGFTSETPLIPVVLCSPLDSCSHVFIQDGSLIHLPFTQYHTWGMFKDNKVNYDGLHYNITPMYIKLEQFKCYNLHLKTTH